jgi:hypothetical protein
MTIALQPIAIRTGSQDSEGQLILADGELVAILVRLADPAHGHDRGQYFLEVGFGPCVVGRPPLFADLTAAQTWVRRRLGEAA